VGSSIIARSIAARRRGWDRLVDSAWNYRIAMVTDLAAPVAWFAYGIRRFPGSAAWATALAVAGFFGFGWLEYMVHRWILHGPFPAVRRSHARHHAEPEALYSAPLGVILAVSVVVWGVLDLALPAGVSAIVVFGLYAGYNYFAVLHHLEHHCERALARIGYLHGLERFHAVHHHRPGVNFGITSTFWDRLLGTFDRRA
jgi:4-hydroxysphinganine ceramide fatty acyl 2-hydroxylase